MIPYLPPDLMAGALEVACYVLTTLAAVFSYLFSARL